MGTEFEKTQAQMTQAVAQIRLNMANAAFAAGRSPADILLCAACKTRTVETVAASAALDIDLFGENHVQELVEKTDANAYCGKPGHFIGHLQTNKVKKVVGRAALIHSVDSERLLRAVAAEAEKQGLRQDILFEINIGDEASKGGLPPESLWPLLEAAERLGSVRVRGLMAIPPVNTDNAVNRGYFAAMKRLLTAVQEQHYTAAVPDILSMGMSDDYENAIAEGATLVRIGTAIYGARDYGTRPEASPAIQ